MLSLHKFKYPKITILIIIIFAAYIIFSNANIGNFFIGLEKNNKLLATFVFGLFFSFGFTTPIAVGFFIVSQPENIILSAVIGGIGALIGDILIFSFFRLSLKDEFLRLSRNSILVKGEAIIKKSLSKYIKIYLLYALIGLVISSPLPDEIGILMLAGLTRVKLDKLIILSFLLNTIGIFILLNL
ncbi:hypothetical protein J4461_01715 [Candidatus Pacearchaeota archaeon]|nr:hypothetical protein [Candidatus Pacearchaeota archaeon]